MSFFEAIFYFKLEDCLDFPCCRSPLASVSLYEASGLRTVKPEAFGYTSHSPEASEGAGLLGTPHTPCCRSPLASVSLYEASGLRTVKAEAFGCTSHSPEASEGAEVLH